MGGALLIATPLALIVRDGPEGGSAREPGGVFTGKPDDATARGGPIGGAPGTPTTGSPSPAPPAEEQVANGGAPGPAWAGGTSGGGAAMAGSDGGTPGAGTGGGQPPAAGQQPPAQQPAPQQPAPQPGPQPQPAPSPCLCETVPRTVCSLPVVSTVLCPLRGGTLIRVPA